jgi:hypothetical protein
MTYVASKYGYTFGKDFLEAPTIFYCEGVWYWICGLPGNHLDE